MYVKLFASMFEGSLYGKRDEILVLTYLLANADVEGFVDIHPRTISGATGIPVPEVKAALLALESPDPESRTPDEEGRRIVRLDDHRDWGWWIVNYEKYKWIRHAEDRKVQNREATKRFREKMANKLGNTSSPGTVRTGQQRGYVYYVYSKINGIKIGFSANPWARMNDMRTASPDIFLLAVERGDMVDEKLRHEQFKEFRLEREWFAPSKSLIAHIQGLELTEGAEEIIATVAGVVTTVAGVVTTQAKADTDTDTDTDIPSLCTTPDSLKELRKDNKVKEDLEAWPAFFDDLPPELARNDFKTVWLQWEQYLKKHHDRVMGLMQRGPAWLEIVSKSGGGDVAGYGISTLRQAMANGWKGLYPKEERSSVKRQRNGKSAGGGRHEGLQAPSL